MVKVAAKTTKYKSSKVEFDVIKFDSEHEKLYYQYLLKLVELKKIKSFELQPLYILIDKFEKDGIKHRAITYKPDFKIYHNDSTIELVDVKGMSTQQGDMRRKLFDARYPEKLTWVSRNIKHGGVDGWIGYDELKKVRAKQSKIKKNAIEQESAF